jgi:hypothetical protein
MYRNPLKLTKTNLPAFLGRQDQNKTKNPEAVKLQGYNG